MNRLANSSNLQQTDMQIIDYAIIKCAMNVETKFQSIHLKMRLSVP